MEPRFGHDFSRVRVHTNAQAADSARAVKAVAYTVGNNIVFREGQYAPETSEGKCLLAHELTHTIQQSVAMGLLPATLAITSPRDAATRTFMEPCFGHDFSHVRVNSNTKAAKSARAVNGTEDGRGLIDHELTHVVRQCGAGSMAPSPSSLPVGTPDDRAEQEAAEVASKVTRGEPFAVAGPIRPIAAPTLHRLYEASPQRHGFAEAVSHEDWHQAFLSLNSLNMYKMLRAIASLNASDSAALWSHNSEFASEINLPRIEYARAVVQTRRLPETAPGDLEATGQVDDARNFLSLGATNLASSLAGILAAPTNYDLLHDLIVAASPSERAAVLANHGLLRRMHERVQIAEIAQLTETLGRLAPSAADLIANSVVQRTLDDAWRASKVGAGLGNRHEEGGYIFMDVFTGAISTVAAPPGPTGPLLAMNLPTPSPPREQICVATYHTHPNPEEGFAQKCSEPDEPLKFKINGIPGIIRSAKGTFWCGPERRAHLGGTRGYPGSSGGDPP
jgi:hypothetical protein